MPVSSVLEEIRAQLVKQFGVSNVPELFLTGGINPGVVLGGTAPVTPIYPPQQMLKIAATAPGAAATLHNIGSIPLGCFDFFFQLDSDDATARLCEAVYLDSGGTVIGDWRFFIGGAKQRVQAHIALDTLANSTFRIRTVDAFTAGSLVEGVVARAQRICG